MRESKESKLNGSKSAANSKSLHTISPQIEADLESKDESKHNETGGNQSPQASSEPTEGKVTFGRQKNEDIARFENEGGHARLSAEQDPRIHSSLEQEQGFFERFMIGARTISHDLKPALAELVQGSRTAMAEFGGALGSARRAYQDEKNRRTSES